MNRVIDPQGNVLIESIGFCPNPGELVEVKVGGETKTYVVTNEPPVTRQAFNGMGGQPFMRFITAKPAEEKKPAAGKVQASGRRGAVVEG